VRKQISTLLVVIFLQVFFTKSVLADQNSTPPTVKSGDEKTDKKAKGHPWKYLVGLPAYYFFVQVPIHQTSHMVAVGLNPNYDMNSFLPVPHYDKNQGRFSFFGTMTFSCLNEKACADKAGAGGIFLAPYIMDAAIFTTVDMLLSFGEVNPGTTAGKLLYLGGMVMPWWDFAFNNVWAPAGSDSDQISRNFKISPESVMLIGMGISTVGLWRIMVNHRRVFSGQAHSPTNKSSLIIVPMSSSETIGVSAYIRF
jgi:hypothetical protein